MFRHGLFIFNVTYLKLQLQVNTFLIWITRLTKRANLEETRLENSLKYHIISIHFSFAPVINSLLRTHLLWSVLLYLNQNSVHYTFVAPCNESESIRLSRHDWRLRNGFSLIEQIGGRVNIETNRREWWPGCHILLHANLPDWRIL